MDYQKILKKYKDEDNPIVHNWYTLYLKAMYPQFFIEIDKDWNLKDKETK